MESRTEESTNLLLSEVKKFDPSEFSRCRAHYGVPVVEGEVGTYELGEDPFEYEITPQQANLLSRLQDTMGWKLSSQDQSLMKGIPPELVGKWRDQTHVAIPAQIAKYDLLK